MYVLAWIFIGAVVGWGAGRVLQGDGYGPFMDIAMGVGGAVGGGLLMRSAGIAGLAGTMVTTNGGAGWRNSLTILAGFANGRRIYASQL